MYTVVIKKIVHSKCCNISVTWVISMHQRARDLVSRGHCFFRKRVLIDHRHL